MRYLGVVGNVFTGLEGLENKIPLYESLLLDEARGTSTGIQIAFENGRVKSIWTNEGAKLPKWPAVPDKSAAIAPGDDVSSIYSKLARMKELGIAAKKLERISLFTKDVRKPYDPGMAGSRQWYFTTPIGTDQFYHVELNIQGGKLHSIYWTLYKEG